MFLMHCLYRIKSTEEPPAWLLQLVLRDVDHSDAQFKGVSDFNHGRQVLRKVRRKVAEHVPMEYT